MRVNENSPHLATARENQQAFERYWSSRGVQVKSDIETLNMGDYTAYILKSNLVMRVPRKVHGKVYGRDGSEIMSWNKRKWR